MRQTVPYRWLALLALALFYGVYYGKLWMQKRQGIQTNQIGRRKEKNLHRVETLMGVAVVSVVLAQLLSIALEWGLLPGAVRLVGFCVALAGDAVFMAAVLCMKDSWRAGIPEKDQTKLVTGGIYAFSRNPAFLGFDLMYAGVLLMYGNPLTLTCSLFAMVMLHLQILQEEAYMEATFGEAYRAYRKHTLRYLGRRKEESK